MGTIIEGDLAEVLRVIKNMHQSAFAGGVMRVITTIKIDERRDESVSMRGKVESVLKGWGALGAAVGVAGAQRLCRMFPLCGGGAVGYKTTRCVSLKEVPASAMLLWVTIVLSMLGVGVGLWLLFSIMV